VAIIGDVIEELMCFRNWECTSGRPLIHTLNILIVHRRTNRSTLIMVRGS
jgi:hypothetical protein